MPEQNSNEIVLQKADPKRRDFLKGVLAAGFAAPLVATFSIDALTAESANAQGAVNTFPNACGDVGYVGPGSFHAHVVAMGSPLAGGGAGVNGEVFFTVQETAVGLPSATGILPAVQMSENTTIAAAFLQVNGQTIAFTSNGLITNNELGKVCDLDALLNLMATDQVAVFIEGHFEGINPFVATGTVHPDPVTQGSLLRLYP